MVRRSRTTTPLTRIILDPDVMGGKPCIRGLRITVGTVVGLVVSGEQFPKSSPRIHPYFEEEDIREALVYTQVLDGALRAAVDTIGGELFTVVHSLTPANERSE